MTTYMAKPGEVEQKWWLVDGTDQVVGRLAAEIAVILMGKHRPTYTPHVDTGDFVIVVNAEKVAFSGKKWQNKVYTHYTGYTGLRTEDRRQTPRSSAGADSERGRPPHAPQEQAGGEDAQQVENLRRGRASASGAIARAQRIQAEITTRDSSWFSRKFKRTLASF